MASKRQAAYIMSIHDVLKLPSLFEDKNNLPKVNVVGIVVSVDIDPQISTVVVDDGTSSIVLRFFEMHELLNSLTIGNIVKIIGSPRYLHNEIYVVPEIIKKIDKPKWIEYRNLELKILKPLYDSLLQTPLVEQPKENNNNDKITEETVVGDMIVEEEVVQNEEIKIEKSENILDKILITIAKLDTGKGAAYDELVSAINHQDCEKLLKKLIEQGEIFEVKPGRIKVL